MSKGRGSAVVGAFAMFFLILVISQSEAAIAVTYTVGDSGGWTFNVAGWPKCKQFKAGNTLVLSYDNKAHNVVAVNRAGYTGCTSPNGAKVYQNGKDQIKLAKGQNFFICNFRGHCEAGMKIAITAT